MGTGNMVGNSVCTCSAKVLLQLCWEGSCNPLSLSLSLSRDTEWLERERERERERGTPSEPNCEAMTQPAPLKNAHRITHNTCAQLLDTGYARGLFRDGPYSHPRS